MPNRIWSNRVAALLGLVNNFEGGPVRVRRLKLSELKERRLTTNAIPKHLVIFGRPGSGKSSLAERLNKDEGYELIRTGELLRSAVRAGNPLGNRVAEHLKRGDLVPDELIFELLEVNLRQPGAKHLIFDGFPRTFGQYLLLEQFEKRLQFQIDCFLEVELSLEAAVQRMTGRRVCPKCGATYHLVTKPPRSSEICDLDGTSLVTRTDDSEEVIKFRQRVYDEHVPPIIRRVREVTPQYFRSVNGNQGPDAVYAETRRVLGLS